MVVVYVGGVTFSEESVISHIFICDKVPRENLICRSDLRIVYSSETRRHVISARPDLIRAILLFAYYVLF